ncbi:MAG: phospho-N-acetylmuramoyl-pentapeptide-transferase [Gammaproteobacteria bacterium]
MLIWLFQYLEPLWHPFQVVHYITFRTLAAALTGLIFALWGGPRLIALLKSYKVGQPIRSDGPATHHVKSGTPTMGGLLILGSLTLSTLLWADLTNRYIWISLLTLWLFGAIGFIDDYRKLILKNPKGLLSREKYAWQSLAALIIAGVLYATSTTPAETTLLAPFFKSFSWSMGIAFIPFVYFVLVGSSNAVNLTDGLDGLAIVPVVLCAATLGVFGYVIGHASFAEYLGFPFIVGTGEMTVYAAALVGSGLGFLWFNAYPAEVFMGDVGSLSLGAVLGVMAIIVRQELLLMLVGGVFVIETLSVMIQVGSFKTRGKRVFKMAPIHHHFELKGWPETKVIVRFWIISVILMLLSLATLKLR